MAERVEVEKVEISLTEYENLIFYKEQINRINEVADEKNWNGLILEM